MKRFIRVLGVDDGPRTADKNVVIAGIVMRAPAYIEGVLRGNITRDGDNVTQEILEFLSSRYAPELRAVMTASLTFGGFNILDVEKVFKKGYPTISVMRKKPDMKNVKNALEKHFNDWERRMELLEKLDSFEWDGVYIQYYGIEKEDARNIVEKFTSRGKLPEPVRVAHLTATAFARGVSNTKP